MCTISTWVNSPSELVQHKQSALDDVAAQQALPIKTAGATAEQNPPGGVSSLSAQSMLNKPACKAVETVPNQGQQATGQGVDLASTEAEEEAESVPQPEACCVSLTQHQEVQDARKRRQSSKGT